MADRIRIIGFALLLITIFIFELTIGESARDTSAIKALEEKNDSNWAKARFLDYTDSVPIIKKSTGSRRIVYLSNSHAFTGGKVTHHLQAMLNIIATGGYEVLNMSDAGIFMPDMLQRATSVLDYDIDVLLLSVGYISFSDRMKLSMQSHSARSFLKSNIVQQLKPGFWLRNYEISLYLDTLFSHGFDLYRYRNEIRNKWEKPISNWLRSKTESKVINAIELDEFRSWRFPDGFDRNLFQWRLYSAGRSNHMSDLQDLIDILAKNDINLIASNLPVDWKKGIHPNDPADIINYQHELENIFAKHSDYQDYENTFPKAFSTYDALHPTWHGARLHALDLLLRLRDTGLVEASDEKLWQAFNESDTQDYQSIAKQNFSPLAIEKLQHFRRLDISEKNNASNLLRRIVSYPPTSDEEIDLLTSLAHRIEYGRRVTNELNQRLSSKQEDPEWEGLNFPNNPLWQKALHTELSKSHKNINTFTQALKSIQSHRISQFPVLDTKSDTIVSKTSFLANGIELTEIIYRLNNGTHIKRLENPESRTIHIDIIPTTGIAYRRIDLLGDGSYIAVTNPTESFIIPPWLWQEDSLQRLGI